MPSSKQLPAYRAFTTTKRPDDQKDFWIPIGAAFMHRDGLGLSLVLQAMPLDGRVVMRPFDEEKPEATAKS